MNDRTICLYLHIHQPWRLKHYGIFDISANHDYFNDETPQADTNNRFILEKVAQKSYRPMNRLLLELLNRYENFELNLSISGTAIEQLRAFAPDVLEDIKKLTATGRVEILAETYNHSLAFFYNRDEFERQVQSHSELIKSEFGITPTAFRNTELAYNNDIGMWAESKGYKAVIAEGWEPILDWRSPNFVYQPSNTSNIRLLLKNYKLSDDIAFRFSEQSWSEWPLTAEKYAAWLNAVPNDQPLINLFMDFETFGEHQWDDTGIFQFMKDLVDRHLANPGHRFGRISGIAARFEPADVIDVPHTITWADTDRDLSAWLGNAMQQDSIRQLYELAEPVLKNGDEKIIEDWRRLQTSDHFYYMCTKWFNDGDVHAYFSPYTSPYEAHINFLNALHDLRWRLGESETT